MDNTVIKINKPPVATKKTPFAEIEWIFFQVSQEKDNERTGNTFTHAKSKYLAFITETLPLDKNKVEAYRLKNLWDKGALIRFTNWLLKTDIASTTKYCYYKSVRQVMGISYAYGVIEHQVIFPPMEKGIRETDERTAYNKEQQEQLSNALARDVRWAERVVKRYEVTGLGTEYIPAGRRFNKPLIEIRPPPNGKRAPMTIHGIEYCSKGEVEKSFNVSRHTILKRLRYGYTQEQAVSNTLFNADILKDEDNMRWQFENTFNCDPSIITYRDSESEFWRSAAYTHHGGPKKLLDKWGVPESIDADIILPVVVQLVSLTALNVDVLPHLTVDSFQKNHPLTGQSYISYTKPRSGNKSSSEDHKLHLPLLDTTDGQNINKETGEIIDIEDGFFLDLKISQKVEKLFNLLLALTKELREIPEIEHEYKDKLIIYRLRIKNATSQQPDNRDINLIDSSYLGKWYKSFVVRHDLRDSKGNLIKFNLSKFRPTVATNMILNGVDIFNVSAVLGHSYLTTTFKYIDSHNIEPEFNKKVHSALKGIAIRYDEQKIKQLPPSESVNSQPGDFIFETLSGCHCKNPFSPDDFVRKRTNYHEGKLCRYWNMCLFCENSIITEGSLPKLAAYRARIEVGLDGGVDKNPHKAAILKSTRKLLDGVLAPDEIFPKDVIDKAIELSEQEEDIILDQLVFQGL